MKDVPAWMVKELRERTNLQMILCKKALQETGGDMEKATEWLRQQGKTPTAQPDAKTAEGLVSSYIHTGGYIGVLVEVTCETDFVARTQQFKDLAHDIAMQIAASRNVEYVQVEDIPADIVEKEKSIEMGRDDLAGKPENIKEKIVQGRVEKRLKEKSLMAQPFIRDQNITIEELIKQNIAQLGENIQVRRFARFVLGEGTAKQEGSSVIGTSPKSPAIDGQAA